MGSKNNKRFSSGVFHFLVIPFFVLIAALTAACNAGGHKPAFNGEPAASGEYIIHITDIHFNPFHDVSLIPQLMKADVKQWQAIFQTSAADGLGNRNKDETNYSLLVSAMRQAALARPRFVIFTGDFICHKFRDHYTQYNNNSADGAELFIKKTIEFVMIAFYEHFPGVPVFFCLGNNDAYEGDYMITPEGAFLKDTAPLAALLLLKNPENRQSFNALYPTGGYFSVKPPLPPSARSRILSLNTNYFSIKYKTGFTAYDPGQKHLEWLESELEQARKHNEKIWLLLHIPPGMDFFDSVTDRRNDFFWKSPYQEKFTALMKQYPSVIQAAFAGHTHMDEFRLLTSETSDVKPVMFVRICPAISPQFGNNPAFTRMVFDFSSHALRDYHTFYVDLSVQPQSWQDGYSFHQIYGQPALDAVSYGRIHQTLTAGSPLSASYMKYYDAGMGAGITDSSWEFYRCGITCWTEAAVNDCVR